MKILIVEDEPNAVRQLVRLLGDYDQNIQILADTDSVCSTVAWLENNSAPDLIFMDIQLADGLSFEIFEQVKVNTPIIFCTAYDEYAIRAFKVNSIDYLLKPLDVKALHDSLAKFKTLQTSLKQQEIDFASLLQQIVKPRKETKSRFLVKRGKRFISIPVEKIAYFLIEYKIVTLLTLEAQRYSIEHSLDELEKMLDAKYFFRVNRQTLLSIQSIQNVENDYGHLNVYLKSQEKKYVVVSRDKASQFRAWLDQ